jgi:hypothetical protein
MKDAFRKYGASFGPEVLKVMGEAFDSAWLVIAGNFRNDDHDIQRARRKLAEALLSIVREHERDSEALKNRALQVMALQYRGRATSPKPSAKRRVKATHWRRPTAAVGSRVRG